MFLSFRFPCVCAGTSVSQEGITDQVLPVFLAPSSPPSPLAQYLVPSGVLTYLDYTDSCIFNTSGSWLEFVDELKKMPSSWMHFSLRSNHMQSFSNTLSFEKISQIALPISYLSTNLSPLFCQSRMCVCVCMCMCVRSLSPVDIPYPRPLLENFPFHTIIVGLFTSVFQTRLCLLGVILS